MIEKFAENNDNVTENVLQESKQDLFDLKKEVEAPKGVPPILKDLYKELLEHDIDTLQLSGEELEFLVNLPYLYYKGGKKTRQLVDNILHILDKDGTIDQFQVFFDPEHKNFNGLNFILFEIGGRPVLSINKTSVIYVSEQGEKVPHYSSWRMGNKPIVINYSSRKDDSGGGEKIESCSVEYLDGTKLEGRCVILRDGNLSPIDENGNYDKNYYLFWNYSFIKNPNGNMDMSATMSPDTMQEYVYTEKRGNFLRESKMLKNLEGQGYDLIRNNNKTATLTKNGKKSKPSEPLLNYKTDSDFEKRLRNAQKEVDGSPLSDEEKKLVFGDFKETYCNGEASLQTPAEALDKKSPRYVLKDFPRYEIQQDDMLTIKIFDTKNTLNKEKGITSQSISMIDEKGNLISKNKIGEIIDQYEIEQTYILFLTTYNSENMHNSGEKYYLSNPIKYESYYTLRFVPDPSAGKFIITITDDHVNVSPVEDEQPKEKPVWKVEIYSNMGPKEIQREIENRIKKGSGKINE